MFRRGGYRKKFGQRFAYYDGAVRARLRAQRSLWLHAVSVGEVAIALKLAKTIAALRPQTRFVLTTTTTTGFAFANKNSFVGMEVMYTPLDFWPVMRRAINAIQPERIILVEAEVWPNLTAIAHAKNIPVCLVNARLSPRSEQRFNRFRWIVAPTFGLLDLVCVQEESDVARWTALGVRPGSLHHTGSIKYDPGDKDKVNDLHAIAPLSINAYGPDNVILFGGSTHSGEEEMLARIFLNLRPEFPQLGLFIAPRHAERARELRRQLAIPSLKVDLVSRVEADPASRPDCVVLDRTGELKRWYGVATVVFVGKSLAATRGGQNPVEPILAGKPVVFGMHMENFAALARELVANEAAVQVADEIALQNAVASLLRNPEKRHRLIQNAERVIESHRGATVRTAKLLLDVR